MSTAAELQAQLVNAQTALNEGQITQSQYNQFYYEQTRFIADAKAREGSAASPLPYDPTYSGPRTDVTPGIGTTTGGQPSGNWTQVPGGGGGYTADYWQGERDNLSYQLQHGQITREEYDQRYDEYTGYMEQLGYSAPEPTSNSLTQALDQQRNFDTAYDQGLITKDEHTIAHEKQSEIIHDMVGDTGGKYKPPANYVFNPPLVTKNPGGGGTMSYGSPTGVDADPFVGPSIENNRVLFSNPPDPNLAIYRDNIDFLRDLRDEGTITQDQYELEKNNQYMLMLDSKNEYSKNVLETHWTAKQDQLIKDWTDGAIVVAAIASVPFTGGYSLSALAGMGAMFGIGAGVSQGVNYFTTGSFLSARDTFVAGMGSVAFANIGGSIVKLAGQGLVAAGSRTGISLLSKSGTLINTPITTFGLSRGAKIAGATMRSSLWGGMGGGVGYAASGGDLKTAGISAGLAFTGNFAFEGLSLAASRIQTGKTRLPKPPKDGTPKTGQSETSDHFLTVENVNKELPLPQGRGKPPTQNRIITKDNVDSMLLMPPGSEPGHFITNANFDSKLPLPPKISASQGYEITAGNINRVLPQPPGYKAPVDGRIITAWNVDTFLPLPEITGGTGSGSGGKGTPPGGGGKGTQTPATGGARSTFNPDQFNIGKLSKGYNIPSTSGSSSSGGGGTQAKPMTAPKTTVTNTPPTTTTAKPSTPIMKNPLKIDPEALARELERLNTGGTTTSTGPTATTPKVTTPPTPRATTPLTGAALNAALRADTARIESTNQRDILLRELRQGDTSGSRANLMDELRGTGRGRFSNRQSGYQTGTSTAETYGTRTNTANILDTQLSASSMVATATFTTTVETSSTPSTPSAPQTPRSLIPQPTIPGVPFTDIPPASKIEIPPGPATEPVSYPDIWSRSGPTTSPTTETPTKTGEDTGIWTRLSSSIANPKATLPMPLLWPNLKGSGSTGTGFGRKAGRVTKYTHAIPLPKDLLNQFGGRSKRVSLFDPLTPKKKPVTRKHKVSSKKKSGRRKTRR